MLRTIIQNWKKKKREAQFRNGYDYAAGELLRGDKTPIYLDSEQCHLHGDNYDSFDHGANIAIQDAIDIGLVEDDRE